MTHTKKHILSLELRYSGAENEEENYYRPKTLLGIYDTFDEAMIEGNKILSTFDFIPATERFAKNYVMGMNKKLVLVGNCFFDIETLEIKNPHSEIELMNKRKKELININDEE